MVVQHVTGFQSLSFETLSFLLTLLSATVTPVFVLSEHWIHLPCGCIINCRRDSYAGSSEELKSEYGSWNVSCNKEAGKLVSVTVLCLLQIIYPSYTDIIEKDKQASRHSCRTAGWQ